MWWVFRGFFGSFLILIAETRESPNRSIPAALAVAVSKLERAWEDPALKNPQNPVVFMGSQGSLQELLRLRRDHKSEEVLKLFLQFFSVNPQS